MTFKRQIFWGIEAQGSLQEKVFCDRCWYSISFQNNCLGSSLAIAWSIPGPEVTITLA